MKDQKTFTYRDNQALDKEIQTLYDNVSRIEAVSSDPNGSRVGKYAGELVEYFSGGSVILKVCRTSGSTIWDTVGTGTSVSTRGTFTNASLVAGVITITHGKGLSVPYALLISIYDNNGKIIIPDNMTGATNSIAIDLTSFAPITGTWGYVYL